MKDGDVASIHALLLEQLECFAKERSDLQPGYTGFNVLNIWAITLEA
jgi:hypothetical protein